MRHIRIGGRRLLGPGLILGLGLGLALALTLAGCAHAPGGEPGTATAARGAPADVGATTPLAVPPALKPMPMPRRLATSVLAGHMRDDAPLRYVVKRGDTLWDIAGKYLDDPWYWPQLWDANPDIANPHLIYPGDVLVLTRGMDGRPHLTRDRTVHLEPRVREQPLPQTIPVVPYSAIRNFLESPRPVDEATLADAPYVVSFEDQHLVAGNGSTVYVRGASPAGPDHYELVHPAGPYRDARSNEIIGRKALPVGRVTIHTFGDSADSIATATIDKSYREAHRGDRLLPVTDENLLRDFYPHTPDQPISAHIISVYGGVREIGQYDVVTLDRGRNAGVRRGDVLKIYESGRTVPDPVAGGEVELPEVEAGYLMVFKVDDQVSFGLIMHATQAIHVGDVVHTPDPA
ncbi:LysM domain-containing protein [Salinisphaera sp.]|uniref:LysM peptidoglycan-binding domain-containing protein n=1 Tax=Salinisphaera sp. TaxID=1914330 RepID=UPI002D7833EA|nr:LysM domain-containing protein [Salinisphaera sp.]HET7313296.1 LysM domain-containing protein [Salinisphaera sp.]